MDGWLHSHAIVSDARPGESTRGKMYEWKFKDREEDNNLYAEQKKTHE